MACIRQLRQSFSHLRVGALSLHHHALPSQQPQLQHQQQQPPSQNSTRLLSTGLPLHKRTPNTVGTYSWVRASRRRKFLTLEMQNKARTEHQIIREEQLKRQPPEVKFKTPGVHHKTMDESKIKQLNTTPQVFLSSDRQTIICYHPPGKNYPIEATKPAVEPPRGYPSNLEVASWRESMTEEEVQEARLLREEDPWLWTPVEISKLFQVKVEVVEQHLGELSPELEAEVKAAAEVNYQMSKMKRKNVNKLNQWAKEKYIRSRKGYEPTSERFERPRMPRPPRF